MSVAILVRTAALLAAFTAPAGAASIQASQPGAAEARAFVQSFYGWYLSRPDEHREDEVLARTQDFEPRLLQDLGKVWNEHLEPGDGLDFDVFTACQEVPKQFLPGAVALKNGRATVAIRAVAPGFADPWPAFDLELEAKDGRWRIYDIHYHDTKTGLRRLLAKILRNGAQARQP
jgi:hypothetical protein